MTCLQRIASEFFKVALFISDFIISIFYTLGIYSRGRFLKIDENK